MNMTRTIGILMLAALPLAASPEIPGHTLRINDDWRFRKGDAAEASLVDFDDSGWEPVTLPHTANMEPLPVNDQWQGICWYRKSLDVGTEHADKKVILTLEGAMSSSKVWINGKLAKERAGGYLPVVIDATGFVKPGQDNVLAVRLDNRDNPLTGPKPLARLDFNMFGGLYRNVLLTIKNKVHVSHPVLADKVAGGGIFITFPKVRENESIVRVKTHVVNDGDSAKTIKVVQKIFDGDKLLAEHTSVPVVIGGGQDREIEDHLPVFESKLWSPDRPYLYNLKTTVLADGKVVDAESTRFGVRRFAFKGHELYVNGKKTFLRGTNRHQEYPFVGYAMSDNAQYRDARKIKEAGFNHVRLSHYPQSPAFMDACDELGLITLNAIMGWQYFLDDERFRLYCYRSATELIRRDRNRASVLAWEVSLNETRMPVPFMEELHRIAHAEHPGPDTCSAGWIDDVYDIFGQARQHRILHGYHENLAKPYFVSEYGDWEYYSSNAGLNQDKLDKTRRYETSSRQRRGYGEKRLLQQARNVQEAHNDNLGTSAYGDAYWVMFDYNRGYHDDIEFSGIMDIFRLPKFAYPFYQSQRGPSAGVVVKIASWWTPESALDLTVYSNCEEVQLFLDEKLISRQHPDVGKNSTRLPHPPFTFPMETFTAGTLKAVGLIGGRPAGEHIVRTPDKPVALKVWLDVSGRAPEAGVNDTVFAHIAAVDAHGTVVPAFSGPVEATLNGDANVMNVGDITAEAGIATALLQIGREAGVATLTAKSGRLRGELRFRVR